VPTARPEVEVLGGQPAVGLLGALEVQVRSPAGRPDERACVAGDPDLAQPVVRTEPVAVLMDVDVADASFQLGDLRTLVGERGEHGLHPVHQAPHRVRVGHGVPVHERVKRVRQRAGRLDCRVLVRGDRRALKSGWPSAALLLAQCKDGAELRDLWHELEQTGEVDGYGGSEWRHVVAALGLQDDPVCKAEILGGMQAHEELTGESPPRCTRRYTASATSSSSARSPGTAALVPGSVRPDQAEGGGACRICPLRPLIPLWLPVLTREKTQYCCYSHGIGCGYPL
jgi:hypothetical protein